MMAIPKIDIDLMIQTGQAAQLDGAGASLIENSGFSADDIGGMNAAQAMVDVVKKLDQALAAYQQLIEKNAARMKAYPNHCMFGEMYNLP